MTTTSTATETAPRNFATEYRTARLNVRRAGGALGSGPFSAIYAAECAAERIVAEADAAGVDLYPVLFELDELARRDYFLTLKRAELEYLTRDPSSRSLAREVLAELGPDTL